MTYRFNFPAIAGTQASRPFFTCMIPLKHISNYFYFDEQEIPPELRAQRSLNNKRVPEIARYITDNRDSYIFSSITASISGDFTFQPLDDSNDTIGMLAIDKDAKLCINDGQHRRAAIIRAIEIDPSLANETISVVFYEDRGLHKSQQMFSDLNRHAAKPTKSLNLLYDTRDDLAVLTKESIKKVSTFTKLIEMDKAKLPHNSQKLFTLGALYLANKNLLKGVSGTPEQKLALCVDYWNAVCSNITEWTQIKNKEQSAVEVRKNFIHVHSVLLQALGEVGNRTLRENNFVIDYVAINNLHSINWRRSNQLWEGVCVINRKITINSNNVTITANKIFSILTKQI